MAFSEYVNFTRPTRSRMMDQFWPVRDSYLLFTEKYAIKYKLHYLGIYRSFCATMYQWNTFYFEAITLIPFYELEKTVVAFCFIRVCLQKRQYFSWCFHWVMEWESLKNKGASKILSKSISKTSMECLDYWSSPNIVVSL